MPGTYNITLYQGDTFSFDVTYKENDTGVDLTGAELNAQIREDKTDTVETAEFAIYMDPDQVANPGKMYLYLDAANSELLSARKYFWDLEIEWPTATPIVQTILAGVVNVTQDVTRD